MKVSCKTPSGTPIATRALAELATSVRRPPSPPRRLSLVRDFEALADPDLVGLLLGLAPNDPFGEWIAERGLGILASHGVGSLAEDAQLGRPRALRLQAAVELGLRVARTLRMAPETQVRSARDVDLWARPRLCHLSHEELWLLLLDARSRVVGERMVARGGLHGCTLHVRDILRPTLREARSAFVLVHNHPGGDPCPSREDVTFTRRLVDAASVVGLVMIDHVVVARDGYVSMLDAGLLGSTNSS